MAEWNVARHIHSAGQKGWPDRIHAVLKRHAVKQIGYVPDTGHARLMELCINDNEDAADVLLSLEAEGPGLVLGAALGGERSALLMRVDRRRQLHQHVLDPEELRHPVCAAGVHAR